MSCPKCSAEMADLLAAFHAGDFAAVAAWNVAKQNEQARAAGIQLERQRARGEATMLNERDVPRVIELIHATQRHYGCSSRVAQTLIQLQAAAASPGAWDEASALKRRGLAQPKANDDATEIPKPWDLTLARQQKEGQR